MLHVERQRLRVAFNACGPLQQYGEAAFVGEFGVAEAFDEFGICGQRSELLQQRRIVEHALAQPLREQRGERADYTRKASAGR